MPRQRSAGGGPRRGARARPAALPASDAALVRHAGRAGLTEDIRATLAEEDARFRRNRGRLGVFIRGDRYLRAYAGQAIDPWQQIERFRAAGARVPSAPPAELIGPRGTGWPFRRTRPDRCSGGAAPVPAGARDSPGVLRPR